MNIDTSALKSAHEKMHFMLHTRAVVQQFIDRAAVRGMTLTDVEVFANATNAFDMKAVYVQANAPIRFDGRISTAGSLAAQGWRQDRVSSRYICFHRGRTPISSQIEEALNAAQEEYACLVLAQAISAAAPTMTGAWHEAGVSADRA